uniref:Cytochrome c oxidase subunit 2 n=1 Tax=Leptorhynchoides thecatus TaxID=60532 RepID=Q5DNB5_LEPTH|nr:cytochrome c oxidase subunit II [Leptorhynchoides thecatus]AAT64942.1 cytochrome c oxidase subunit II [Leptorhynchoides thecatus]
MSHWGDMLTLDGFSFIMEGLIQFNDYVMGLSMIIFWFVVMLLIYMWVEGVSGDRDLGGTLMLEAVWTVLPMILLIFMAYPSLVLLYLGDVRSCSELSVVVTGHQWYWEYSSGCTNFDSYMSLSDGFRVLDVDNRLILPIDINVSVLLTSSDVIHSWAVPSLGFKVDCVPGRLNHLFFSIVKCGVYYGQCSELCGAMHSFMPIVIEGISVGDFICT